jgi:hypothetical protein
MLERPQVVDEALPAHVARYDWQQQIGKYDDLFAGVQDNLVKSSLR